MALSKLEEHIPAKQFDFDDFYFHEKLGEGGCGTVTRVTFKTIHEGQEQVAAVKNVLELRREEIEILAKLSHENIVELYGYIQKGPMNMIVLEYAPLGSVRDYIKENGCTPVRGDLLRKWLRESALALQHLHANRIIHRDVKGANCILFEGHLLKLADFGIARYIGESMVTSSAKGTWRYTAPEINSENHFSFASDVYGYGMLAIEMVTGREPFEGMEWQCVVYKVVRSNLRPNIPRECPKLVALLMRLCWSSEPSERPTADDIVDLLHSDHSPRFNSLRVVVVGNQDSAKSAVARRVLFRPNQADEGSNETDNPKRLSRTCKRHQGQAFGRSISLVDTPGGFGVNDSVSARAKNIVAQVKFLSAPGPHVILLVIQINSSEETVDNIVAQLCRHFGENVFKYVVVLFTEDPTATEVCQLPITDNIETSSAFRQLLQNCDNRYLLFGDNCSVSSMCNRDQVQELMAIINQMIGSNGGRYVKVLN